MPKVIDTFIFDSYKISDKSLGLYRICFALFFILFGIPNFSWISGSPDIFYDPPLLSMARLFSGFPPSWFLYSLSILLCVLFVLLLFGVYTRVVSVLIPFLIIIGHSFSYSFGKIDHDLIIWLVPFCMAFAGWGNALSIDKKYREVSSKNRSWCISMLALLLGFAFFTAGFPKIVGGWLNPDSLAVRYYVFQAVEIFEREPLLGTIMLNYIPNIIWKPLDYLTVLFEIGFLIAVLKESVFKKFVFTAIFFHLIIFLMMGITTSWLYIVYLLFIDWDYVQNHIHKLFSYKQINNFMSLKILIAFLVLALLIYINGQLYLEQPALSTISPLSMAAHFLNLDYGYIFGTVTTLLGALLGLALLRHSYEIKWL